MPDSLDTFKDYTLVGQINISKAIRVTDPCYGPDVWCTGQFDVLPGNWNCFVLKNKETGFFDEILMCHEDYAVRPDNIEGFDAGVDSGNLCFTDADYYLELCKDAEAKREWFYNQCQKTFSYTPCKQTMSFSDFIKSTTQGKYNDEESLLHDIAHDAADVSVYKNLVNEYECGIMVTANPIIANDRVFLSHTAYGDGSYLCRTGKNAKGEIVSASVNFVEGEDEDNEED